MTTVLILFAGILCSVDDEFRSGFFDPFMVKLYIIGGSGDCSQNQNDCEWVDLHV